MIYYGAGTLPRRVYPASVRYTKGGPDLPSSPVEDVKRLGDVIQA